MKSAINHMDKYDHRRHGLSDWLAKLELRFQLGEVDTDQSKITWCQLIIGATGSNILASLEDEASWETAKETLLSRLGIGSMKDEAWAALKNYTKGSKEIVELAGEVEKLARRSHPHDEEATERQAMDTFLSVLEHPLAAEVQKLGCHTMENVVAAPRRIEKVLAEQADSKKSYKCRNKSDSYRKALRLSKDKLRNRRPLPQLPQLAQPLSRLLPLSLHRLLPLATPTRTPLRVHRANHWVSHLHHASSVEKRGIPPPDASPSSTSSASHHRPGYWKGHLGPRWPRLGVG